MGLTLSLSMEVERRFVLKECQRVVAQAGKPPRTVATSGNQSTCLTSPSLDHVLRYDSARKARGTVRDDRRAWGPRSRAMSRRDMLGFFMFHARDVAWEAPHGWTDTAREPRANRRTYPDSGSSCL